MGDCEGELVVETVGDNVGVGVGNALGESEGEPVGDIVVGEFVDKEESAMLSLRTASSGSDATKYVHLPRCSHATLNPTTSAFRFAAVIWHAAT